MNALDRKRGDQSLVQRATADAASGNGPGKRTLTEQLAPGVPGAAPEHTAAAHPVAERDALNAVITVVARGPDGAVVARWRARGRWVGRLPARYHGTRAPWAWSWTDPAARDTRIHTRADGTGGEPVERWATAHGAATLDVIATAIGAPAPDGEAEAHADPAAAPSPTTAAAKHGRDPLAGLDAEHPRIDEDRDLAAHQLLRRKDYPENGLRIGYDAFGSPLVLILTGARRGEIWYLDVEDDREDRPAAGVDWFDRMDVWSVAASFREFMASLGPLDTP